MATITAPTPSGTTVPPSSREGAPWRPMIREVLLVCGIVSSLLYVALNVLGALRFPGYSLTS